MTTIRFTRSASDDRPEPAAPPASDRYARQRLVAGWDQDRLGRAKIVIAGAGALGNELLKNLALLGVGSLLIVDFDEIAPSNLSRTALFRDTDIGQPKALVAAERARALNPEISVTGLVGDIGRDLGLAALADADLVVAGLDNIEARWLLNRRALLAGVPWLNGGISAHEGQVTRHEPGRGSCYECTLTPRMIERFNARYSCTGLVQKLPPRIVPTTAVGAAAIGALQTHEALTLLHGAPDALAAGHRLTLLLNQHRLIVDELPVNPECAAHTAPARASVRLEAGPDILTAADVAAVEPAGASVALGFNLVEAFLCPDCGREELVGRPAALVATPDAVCPGCGAERRPTIVHRLDTASPLWTVPLARLGVAPRELLRVHAGDDEPLERWVEIGGSDPWRISRNALTPDI